LSTTANINPIILKWARETQGLSHEEVTSKKQLKKISSWEDGSTKPTMNQLLTLAHLYRRPSAIFFLSKPPEGTKEIWDFRSSPIRDDLLAVSPTLKTEIRLCEYRRNRALELADVLEEETMSTIPSAKIESDVEDTSTELSRFLNVDFKRITMFKDDTDALNYWIELVEEKSILVFRSCNLRGSNPSYEEVRGVSSYEDEFPWILLNSQEHPRGQLFSLGHELIHLMMRSSGLCDLHEKGKSDIIQHEQFCNQVSASVLMPRKIIDRLIKENSLLFRNEEQTESAISIIQKNLHTSKESIARRLVTLGHIAWDYYNRVRTESMKSLDNHRKNPPKFRSRKGFSTYFKRVMRWNGPRYTNLTTDAYMSKKISRGRAAEMLGTTIFHFNSIVEDLYR